MSHFDFRAIKVKNKPNGWWLTAVLRFRQIPIAVWQNLFVLSLLLFTNMCRCEDPSENRLDEVILDGEDSCDWKGSGFDSPSGRSVRPVYLRCSQGKVQWTHPRDALRIQLRSGHRNKEFQGCIKVVSPFRGARIYVEGHRSLRPLASPQDPEPSSLPRCFMSRGGQAVLYLEADVGPSSPPSNGSQRQVVFHYDLETVQDPVAFGSGNEECRPCDSNELVQAFCNSEFVARGRIVSVTKDENMQRNNIQVIANHIFRQTGAAIFSDNVQPSPPPPSTQIPSSVGRQTATLHFPGSCSVRPTLPHEDEYVFMGRMKLGDPFIKCSATLSEWIRVMRKADDEGTAICALAA
ncbi:unnamed protein product [Cyprideis torosa]|uniref:Uncharacterized protein n=1 Tax=Cyprideis torosa TaxID=163714 RepID=A0A7R8WDZ5_9CRUS|nr:unnamed protein product [Cyprideis torosa]CAG0895186.1 unnamed protein product [Cyprideis torosa]